MSIIQIKNLSKVYPSKKGDITAINNINLEIEENDIFGIIGLSGAGKSTLIRCINYLEKPTSGEVVYKGVSLANLKEKELRNVRKEIGMIFQRFNLLEQRTVLKNVMLAGELSHNENVKEKAIKLLELVGLKDKMNDYPSSLSGGQQQRVAIARALMTEPKILLCDEPTSALDPETTSSILELLKSLNKNLGLTIIIISHQMSVIEAICNRVAIIDNAQIVECGQTMDVFLSPRTEIGKKLIYSGQINTKLNDEKLIKLIFNGEVDSPIIANIVCDCNILVSVMYASTKTIDDKVYGQLIFKLPYYEHDIAKLKKYLELKNIVFEEVDVNDLV